MISDLSRGKTPFFAPVKSQLCNNGDIKGGLWTSLHSSWITRRAYSITQSKHDINKKVKPVAGTEMGGGGMYLMEIHSALPLTPSTLITQIRTKTHNRLQEQ